jgi:hypothetical protein
MDSTGLPNHIQVSSPRIYVPSDDPAQYSWYVFVLFLLR